MTQKCLTCSHFRFLNVVNSGEASLRGIGAKWCKAGPTSNSIVSFCYWLFPALYSLSTGSGSYGQARRSSLLCQSPRALRHHEQRHNYPRTHE